MILGLLTLLSALIISGISAYFSIVGLAAIFSAAVIPIIIMGASLELGKVATVVWLHYNWDRADWKIKSYLTLAVIVLMFITSMGIFGFLSKGHADQAVPTGDIQSQVTLFDEKIKTQRDNIDASKKALIQMDGSVDQLLARSTTETGASKAAALRKSQAKERASLQKDIDDAQKTITKLQEERAPVASQLRKVVADVGPIRYIAAVIYGDKADETILEAAVRWVIMIIVAVFDPLAIVLILAATTSIDWSAIDRRKRKHDKVDAEIEEAAETARLNEAKNTLGHKDEAHVAELIAHAVETTRAQCEVEFEKRFLSECDKCAENSSHGLSVANEQIQQNTEDLQQRERELGEVIDHVSGMTDHVAELTGMLNAMEETVTSALSREEAAKADLSLLVAEYDTLLADKLAMSETLATANDSLQELETLRDSIAVKQAEAAALRDEVTAAKQQYEVTLLTYQDESAKLQDAIEKQKVLEEELAAADETISSLKEKINQSETQQSDLKQLIDQLELELAANKNIHIVTVGQEPLGAEFASVLQENLWDLYETEPEPEGIIEPVVEQGPEAFAQLLSEEIVEQVEVDEVVAAIEDLAVEPEIVEPIKFEPVAPREQVVRKVPDYSLGFDANVHIPGKESVLMPEVVPMALPKGGNASFGTSFPPKPIKGDMFLRVDYVPSRLFKWNDSKWMPLNKAAVDAYSYDEEYIKLLINKVSTGEYDADELSELEQEQVAEYLRTHTE